MATIKKTKCACGAEYIDYDACIGKCPKCEGSLDATIRQTILQSYTYMTTDAAFKSVLTLLVETRRPTVVRLSCEESHKCSGCNEASVQPKESLIDRIMNWCRR